ncbi:MAG: calcineurin-like phosphoesterase family protein [Candidatus Omnitrophica bacterium]|nr:calcineurin-like phosphoesterase family protein [Candidatus Omnitrophota bacterium]MCA9448746.1 calcineurin-like phosphoesterase family protein [Candidatus Omnitrophota bacterium]
MTRLITGTFLLLGLLGLPSVAETAKGLVFHDLNDNRRFDPDEKGLAGILVSNGTEVVPTDGEGKWSLPVGDDDILFVIKPSGWRVPLNDHRIPQNYYIHRPTGSPKVEAENIEPTGSLPESIDFPLYPQEEPETFSTVFFADTQARGIREVNFVIRDAVEELIGSDIAFGVSLGDIVADDPALFDPINAAIAQIGVPWYNAFGNHDNNKDVAGDRPSHTTFEKTYGPSTYAFEYAKVAFIALDNIVFKEEGGHDTRIRDRDLLLVKSYLQHVPKDRLVVLFMHAPLRSCGQVEKLLALLSPFPHTFSVAGHWHRQNHFFLGEDFGWTGKDKHHHFVNGTVSGSWWCGLQDELGIPHAVMNDGVPNGYSFIDFDGVDYQIRYKACRRPADYQMNIYVPMDIPLPEAATTEVLVNVFNGSERSKVEISFDDRCDWTPLEQTRDIDPECLRMHELSPYLDQEVLGAPLEDVLGWKMDFPSRTGHMWKGFPPKDLIPGSHIIRVRHIDPFGPDYEDQRIIRVHP